MAGFPGFEFASHIFPSRRAQFGDDAGMLRGEPVLKFVERFDGGENGGGDFNGFRFHGGSLARLARNGKSFPFHGFSGKIISLVSWLSALALQARRDDPAGRCPV
jgi:hypothetical protein